MFDLGVVQPTTGIAAFLAQNEILTFLSFSIQSQGIVFTMGIMKAKVDGANCGKCGKNE
jgi:hypothetical protein